MPVRASTRGAPTCGMGILPMPEHGRDARATAGTHEGRPYKAVGAGLVPALMGADAAPGPLVAWASCPCRNTGGTPVPQRAPTRGARTSAGLRLQRRNKNLFERQRLRRERLGTVLPQALHEFGAPAVDD